ADQVHLPGVVALELAVQIGNPVGRRAQLGRRRVRPLLFGAEPVPGRRRVRRRPGRVGLQPLEPVAQVRLLAAGPEQFGLLVGGALAGGLRRVRRWASSPWSRSRARVRLPSTAASLRSVSVFFALNRLMPAASSKISRRSVVDAWSNSSTRPWAMTVYPPAPAPLPRKISLMSFSRDIWPLIRYSPVPSR